MAKIEVPKNRIKDSLIYRETIVDSLKEFGFQQVLLDLEGYKKQLIIDN